MTLLVEVAAAYHAILGASLRHAAATDRPAQCLLHILCPGWRSLERPLGQCHVCIDDTSRIHSAHERRGARTHTLPHNAGSKRPLLKTCAVRLGSRPCPPGVWRRREREREAPACVHTSRGHTAEGTTCCPRAPHAARVLPNNQPSIHRASARIPNFSSTGRLWCRCRHA